MSIPIADRRNVPEAVTLPATLVFKGADTDDTSSSQTLAVNDAEGIVTAIVSVTGTEDEVADIIEPGAYAETLTKRRPKVCWAHSWERPIGRVLHIEELLPGDPRLPKRTREGKAWPREAGALVATMQFNLRSDTGREAFEAVRFYSETGEAEFSIGYTVPPGKATRDQAGVRHIKGLDLYELSVVLFGAHTMTGTLSIKDAVARARAPRGPAAAAVARLRGIEAKASAADAVQSLSAASPGDTTQAEQSDPATADRGTRPVPDHSDGVMVAVYPDPHAAAAIAAHLAGPDTTTPVEDLHVTLAYLGTTSDVDLTALEIADLVTGAVDGFTALEGQIGGLGEFPAGEDGTPVWAPVDVPGLGLLREQVVAALGDAVTSVHGFTPYMTLGYDLGRIAPVPLTPVRFGSVRVVHGAQMVDVPLRGDGEGKGMSAAERDAKPTLPGSDGAFPIGNRDDLVNAIQAFGRAKDKTKAKAWIIRRARELGATSLLPDGWDVKTAAVPDLAAEVDLDALDIAEVIRLTAIESLLAETKAGGADRNRGGAEKLRRYWTVGAGGAKIRWNTPGDHTRCTRLLSEHMTPDRAAAYCNLRHREMTGVYAGDRRNKTAGYDPTLEAPTVSTEGKDAENIPGTYEERRALLTAAAREALAGNVDDDGKREWDHVTVRATWDDRFIATRWGFDGAREEDWEIPYLLTDDGVELGSPRQVRLELVAVPADGLPTEPDDDEDLVDALGLPEQITDVAFVLASAHRDSLQVKAGRVLSGRNERALRDAVQRLLAVLASAGVDIDPDDAAAIGDQAPSRGGDGFRPPPPGADLESTAPSAQMKRLDLAQVNADLARLGLPQIG